MSKYIEGFKVKYKTEICKNWETTGHCEFSSSCSFAHGPHELKQKTDVHKNYKTKHCKKFTKDGFCPYGVRCQFLHDEKKEDLQPPKITISKKALKGTKSKKSKAKAQPTIEKV